MMPTLTMPRFFAVFLLSFFLLPELGMSENILVAQDDPVEPAKPAENIPIEPHKVGRFKIERSSMPVDLYLRAHLGFGNNVAANFPPTTRRIKSDNPIDYEVVVPADYTGETPYGVFVFISATDSGKLPGPWYGLFAKHKIIAIGANDGGNKTGSAWRTGMAAFAARLIDEGYTIDYDRIYVSGCSGGGFAASIGMMTFQDIFTGGVPIIGAKAVLPMKNVDSGGTVFPDPGIKSFSLQSLQTAATTGRYAFVTGEKDYNRMGVLAVAQGYKAAGFQFVTYLEQPGIGHKLCSAEWLEKAIEFLDAPLPAIADVRFKMAKKSMRKQPGLAFRYFQAVLMHSEDADVVEEAKAKFAELGDSYQKALEQTQAKVAKAKSKTAIKLVEKLAEKWGEISATDVAAMHDEIKARDP